METSKYVATVSFTTVVDNLSKRVPSSALRELFDHFGRVTDVCVAYFNPRRKIDGFVISVSTAKYVSKSDNLSGRRSRGVRKVTVSETLIGNGLFGAYKQKLPKSSNPRPKVYSLEMVQKALLSENIKCKICPWGGPSSILAIDSSNDLEDWEHFVSLDPDTRDRNRLDVAKMVVKVVSKACIPHHTYVVSKGTQLR
ncbi:hypothetical protein GOBAR_DD31248 [Gossypium barbadense]|nr:hypothetical protein GOBAR_DD31248 [Gossypium barbadense]